MHRTITLLLLTSLAGCGAEGAKQLPRNLRDARAPRRATTRSASFHKTISKTIGYDYLVQLPRGYQPSGTSRGKFPLIVFLHGSGECGHDLDKVANHALPKIARQRGDDFPFVLIAPQMPVYDGWWSVES